MVNKVVVHAESKYWNIYFSQMSVLSNLEFSDNSDVAMLLSCHHKFFWEDSTLDNVMLHCLPFVFYSGMFRYCDRENMSKFFLLS